MRARLCLTDDQHAHRALPDDASSLEVVHVKQQRARLVVAAVITLHVEHRRRAAKLSSDAQDDQVQRLHRHIDAMFHLRRHTRNGGVGGSTTPFITTEKAGKGVSGVTVTGVGHRAPRDLRGTRASRATVRASRAMYAHPGREEKEHTLPSMHYDAHRLALQLREARAARGARAEGRGRMSSNRHDEKARSCVLKHAPSVFLPLWGCERHRKETCRPSASSCSRA